MIQNSNSSARILCGAALALCALAPWSLSAGGDDNPGPGEASLLPPNGAPDSDGSGKLSLEKGPNEQKFYVRTEDLDGTVPPGPFEVWLETTTTSDTFALAGVMSLKPPANKGRWELTLKKEGGGAPTALGVADLADITGREVQVRNAGGATVYLSGTAPEPKADDGGGGGGGGGNNSKLKREVALQRPDPAPDDNAFGKAKLEMKGNEQKFEVEAGNLSTDGASTYTVHIETTPTSDAFFSVGSMILKNAVSGAWELELKATGAAPAALQVASLTELAGRELQIRDGSSATVLHGELPVLSAGVGQGNLNSKSTLFKASGSPSENPSGWVRIKFNAPQGWSEFEVEAKKLNTTNGLSVFVEDGLGSNVFVNVGAMTLKGSAPKVSARYRVRTKKGDSLPLGVFSLGELSGRKLELRDGSGAAHLAGAIP